MNYHYILNVSNPFWTGDFFGGALQGLIALFLGVLVYKYTTNDTRINLLNSLDEKSGWRRTLYEVAGKEQITFDDTQKLRASLRFNHDKNIYKSNFSYMTYIIINYLDDIQKKKIESISTNYNLSITIEKERKKILLGLEKEDIVDDQLCSKDSEIIRLFCRYLLADHWEKNQLTQLDRYNIQKKLKKNKIFFSYSNNKITENICNNCTCINKEHFNRFLELFYIIYNIFNKTSLKKAENIIRKDNELTKYTLEKYNDFKK